MTLDSILLGTQIFLDANPLIYHFRNSRIQILATSLDLVVRATRVSHQFALLSGDALVIAVMQANGLTNLASHDTDFDCVPGITRFSPI